MKIRNLRSRQNRVSCFGRGEWNEIPAFARMTIVFRCSCGDALHFEKNLRLLTQSVRGIDNKGRGNNNVFVEITGHYRVTSLFNG